MLLVSVLHVDVETLSERWATMRPVTEQLHDDAEQALDELISVAHEAKENFLLKRYEDAACNLDEAVGARKRAEALINEMWE